MRTELLGAICGHRHSPITVFAIAWFNPIATARVIFAVGVPFVFLRSVERQSATHECSVPGEKVAIWTRTAEHALRYHCADFLLVNGLFLNYFVLQHAV